jgi:hypothetical protein
MANSVNLINARFAAKPPPVKYSFDICTNPLLHEPYSNKNYEIYIKQLVQRVLDTT